MPQGEVADSTKERNSGVRIATVLTHAPDSLLRKPGGGCPAQVPFPGWEKGGRRLVHRRKTSGLTARARQGTKAWGDAMGKTRLEAFSDGVIAIIITIMVLELKVPHDTSLAALTGLWPIFLSYVLSFANVAIYWHNHHHMLHLAKRVSGGVLWANTHLLFWLSLMPFTTGWMGENHIESLPVAVYGIVLLMSGVAYYILQLQIIRVNGGANSDLARAIGRDLKGRAAPLVYIAGIALSFVNPWLGITIYVLFALVWLIPDRRIERVLRGD
jgi:uncharacterized membrane protein